MGLLEMKKRLAEEGIARFESEYRMNSAEFMRRFEAESWAILKIALNGGAWSKVEKQSRTN